MVEQYIIDRTSGFNEAFHQLKADFFRFWLSDIFLTWHWWLEAVLAVLPWVVWAAVRKKESAKRLFCAGFFVLIVSSYLDMLGMSMGLWGYHSAVIPTIPPYAPGIFRCCRSRPCFLSNQSVFEQVCQGGNFRRVFHVCLRALFCLAEDV
jgi:hypothetical protein